MAERIGKGAENPGEESAPAAGDSQKDQPGTLVAGSAIRSLILAGIVCIIVTAPSVLISIDSAKYLATGTTLNGIGDWHIAVYVFALTDNGLFDLFNVVALPTLTALVGVDQAVNKRMTLTVWVVFFYLLSVFVISFFVSVVDAQCPPNADPSKLCTWVSHYNELSGFLKGKFSAVTQYVENVRDSALAALFVLAGIRVGKS